MTKRENLRLINLYYRFLKLNKMPPILKALKLFYPVKIHPEYFEERNISIIEIQKKIFNKILYVLKNYLDKFFYFQKLNVKKSKVLVLSHLINTNHLNSNKDFYFGDMSKILKKKKISYQFLLINHTNVSSYKLNSKNKNKNKKWIMNKLLDTRLEIYLILTQLKILLWIILNRKFFLSKIDLKKIIFSLFHNETKFALRCNLMIKKYLKIIQPDYLITTFEGFPWERQIFKSTKDFNKKIKIIGYQQIYLNENYKSIFFKLSKNYDPDIIWTLDKYSKKLFLNSDLKNKKIKVLGNLKKRKKKYYVKNNFKKIKNNTLILPEGIESECIKLFNYSISLALAEENLNFIWRLHPVIDVKKILKKMRIDKSKLPSNIFFSKEKYLEKDLTKCKYIIYRGSSAAIDSLNFGLIPIYLKLKNEPNIDILRSFKKDYNYVTSPEDFLSVIKKYKKTTKISVRRNFRNDANIIRINEFKDLK